MPIINMPERDALLRWMKGTTRSTAQNNEAFTADCELIKLDDKTTLAITIDTLSEEIALGLYKDPYTMGWIAATASLSDLAAVGATYTGLLFSASFADGAKACFKERVSLGFCDALRHANTHLLGGDSSSGVATVLTSTGVGVCKRPPITRLGAQQGDLLVLTGRSGIGPALAYEMLLEKGGKSCLEEQFRPTIDEAARTLLADNARAMIDTSDGILAAITTLCALNSVGARLTWNEQTLDQGATAFCRSNNLPLWALWVAEHGDYQLLAVIPKEKVMLVDGHARIIGEITSADTFELCVDERKLSIDPTWGQLVGMTDRNDYGRRCLALLEEFRQLEFP